MHALFINFLSARGRPSAVYYSCARVGWLRSPRIPRDVRACAGSFFVSALIKFAAAGCGTGREQNALNRGGTILERAVPRNNNRVENFYSVRAAAAGISYKRGRPTARRIWPLYGGVIKFEPVAI